MIHNPNSTNNNLSVFLLGAILNILATVDYVSLIDYSLKAIIGGAIWLLFKIAAEYFTKKINGKHSGEDK